MARQPVVDMRGTCDLHIHSGPCIFNRVADDLGIAQMAREAGQAAIILKSHHESTVSRAAAVQRQVPEVCVFGSLTLNWFTGGLVPAAVEVALRQGAKEIWMPTIHAARHGAVYGVLGDYGTFSMAGMQTKVEGITLLADGRLKPEVEDIVRLIAEHDAILGTGHIDRQETYALVKAARAAGVNKILITHPHDHFVRFDDESLLELVEMGCMLELCSGGVQPVPGYATIQMVSDTMKRIGPEHIIISSDAGAPRKPVPVECTRVYGNCLLSRGITVEQFDLMAKTNPRRLVGLADS
jgi:hypothetical protein